MTKKKKVKREPENCDACSGSGNLECDTCDSAGWVDDPSDGGTMTCPDCQGEKCIECNGEGVIE